jgi:hypothetical protein
LKNGLNLQYQPMNVMEKYQFYRSDVPVGSEAGGRNGGTSAGLVAARKKSLPTSLEDGGNTLRRVVPQSPQPGQTLGVFGDPGDVALGDTQILE